MIEWRDSGLRADQVLVMALTIAVQRAGGTIRFERGEWESINRLFVGEGALLIREPGDDEQGYTVTLGTTASAGQHGVDGAQA